jgi:hypothetical protein
MFATGVALLMQDGNACATHRGQGQQGLGATDVTAEQQGIHCALSNAVRRISWCEMT